MGGKNGDDVTLKMLQRWEGRGEFPKKEIKWKKEEKRKKKRKKISKNHVTYVVE